MELEYTKVIYTLAALIVLAVIFGRRKKGLFPPGPVGLPYFGHLFYFKINTLDQLRDLHKEYGKTIHLKMAGTDVIM